MRHDFLIHSSDDRVVDRLAIADAAYVYGAAVDMLGNNPVTPGAADLALEEAVSLMAQALTPDARLRLLLAGAQGPAQPLGTGGPRAAAEAVRAIPNGARVFVHAEAVRAYFTAYGYVATYHPVSNVRIAFTGLASATATCRIPCYHWLADGRMLLTPVNYEDRLIRHNGVWQIAERDIFAARFWITEGYTPNPLDPSLERTV